MIDFVLVFHDTLQFHSMKKGLSPLVNGADKNIIPIVTSRTLFTIIIMIFIDTPSSVNFHILFLGVKEELTKSKYFVVVIRSKVSFNILPSYLVGHRKIQNSQSHDFCFCQIHTSVDFDRYSLTIVQWNGCCKSLGYCPLLT